MRDDVAVEDGLDAAFDDVDARAAWGLLLHRWRLYLRRYVPSRWHSGLIMLKPEQSRVHELGDQLVYASFRQTSSTQAIDQQVCHPGLPKYVERP